MERIQAKNNRGKAITGLPVVYAFVIEEAIKAGVAAVSANQALVVFFDIPLIVFSIGFRGGNYGLGKRSL